MANLVIVFLIACPLCLIGTGPAAEWCRSLCPRQETAAERERLTVRQLAAPIDPVPQNRPDAIQAQAQVSADVKVPMNALQQHHPSQAEQREEREREAREAKEASDLKAAIDASAAEAAVAFSPSVGPEPSAPALERTLSEVPVAPGGPYKPSASADSVSISVAADTSPAPAPSARPAASEHSLFCHRCGKHLPEDPDTKFCNHCGCAVQS